MKKLMKIVLSCLLMVMIVGCGGTSSTDKQEAVVKDFIEAIRNDEFDKAETYCTEDNKNFGSLSTMVDQLKVYQNADTYGQTFVDETNKFVKTVFNELITSYEIKEIKEEDGKYKVSVSAKMKDLSGISFDQSELTSMMQEYQTKHLSELQKIATEKGQSAVIEKVMSDLAPTLFNSMAEKVKGVEAKDATLNLTLVESGDTYLIEKIG